MYPVAIIGHSPAAQLAALACNAGGFREIARYAGPVECPAATPILSLGANASRLLRTLAPDAIDALGYFPDRQQVRFAKSAYLLAELPLGNFMNSDMVPRWSTSVLDPSQIAWNVTSPIPSNRQKFRRNRTTYQLINRLRAGVLQNKTKKTLYRLCSVTPRSSVAARQCTLARQGSVHRAIIRYRACALPIRNSIKSSL